MVDKAESLENSSVSGSLAPGMSNTVKGIVLAALLVALGGVVWLNVLSDADAEPQMTDAEKAFQNKLTGAIGLYQSRKFDEAEQAFESILDEYPDKPLVLSYLGVLARDREQLDKAEGYFKRAIEVDENSPQHYYNLALLYFSKRRDYPACEAQLARAMRLGHKGQYSLLFALCAVEGGKPEREIRSRLRRTIRVAENQAHAFNEKALTPTCSLAAVWKKSARLLKKRGDDFGYTRLRKQIAESPKAAVREFAKAVLANLEKDK